MLRVAIIGLGDISPIHSTAINDSGRAKLVAVCDVDESKKSGYPEIPFYTDVKTMLAEADLDVAHICLPHYLHYPITKLCIENGVHVFQEKPLSISYEEGLETVALEEQTDKKICVSFQNRYNDTFLQLQHILANEDVGKVTSIKGLVTWYRPESYYTDKPWRGTKKEAGYGSIINQSIHTLDLIQLIGGKIESCKASLSNLTDYAIEVEDTASAAFNFENGVKAFFHATNAYTENSSVELQVITEKEKFTIKDSRLYFTNEEGRKEVILEDQKIPGSKFYYGVSHMTLIKRFYLSLLNDTEDYVHAKDALVSMEMIELMDQSSRTNQKIRMEEMKHDNRKDWRTSDDAEREVRRVRSL